MESSISRQNVSCPFPPFSTAIPKVQCVFVLVVVAAVVVEVNRNCACVFLSLLLLLVVVVLLFPVVLLFVFLVAVVVVNSDLSSDTWGRVRERESVCVHKIWQQPQAEKGLGRLQIETLPSPQRVGSLAFLSIFFCFVFWLFVQAHMGLPV